MPKKLTPTRAAELKARGITKIASTIKNTYNTNYYGVATIDRILDNAGRRPHNANYCKNGEILPCECGVTARHIDWETTILWSQI